MNMFVHSLCGFSAGINWKPIAFHNPLPSSRICSKCGVVAKLTALLPSGDSLCGFCYGRATDADFARPIEVRQFSEELVQWLEFTEDAVAVRKVGSFELTRHGCVSQLRLET